MSNQMVLPLIVVSTVRATRVYRETVCALCGDGVIFRCPRKCSL